MKNDHIKNIAHINTNDKSGGAATVARRLTEWQVNRGYNSHLIVGYKQTELPFVKQIDIEKDITIDENFLDYNLTGSYNLLFDKLVHESQILHLHNLHGGYFNPFTLIPLSMQSSLIWTLHDMQSFTGHCAHSLDCNKWKSGCGNCPYLNLYPALKEDITSKLLKDKKYIYQNSDFVVTTPSNWLREKAESSILKDKRIEVINNSVNTSHFSPMDKAALKRKYNIPQNTLVLGSISNGGLKNPWKGGSYALNVLEILKEKNINFIFLNIGSTDETKLPFVINVPPLGEEKDIVEMLSLMDIFIFTSIAENAPLVIIEALSCGVPIVSFDVGGVPEMVENNVNGYIVKYLDTLAMAKAIVHLANNKENLLRFSENNRTKAIKNFDESVVASKYIELYNSVFEDKKRKISDFSHSSTREINNYYLSESSLKKKSKLGQNYFSIHSKSSPNIPKISIVTPSYNQGEFLEETIQSVLDQNYPNLEYIIMDGGSTDNSVEIIKKYEKYLTYWQSKPDGGQYRAVTDGFARTTGEIMTWINSDDLLAPFSLLTAAAIFVQYENIDWITGKTSIYNQETNQIGIEDCLLWNRKKYLQETYKYIQQEGTFWRRSLYLKVGGYVNPEYKLASDLELWVRFFRHSKLFTFEYPFGVFRFHGNQKSVEFLDEYLKEADEIIAKENKMVNMNNRELDSSENYLQLRDISLSPLTTINNYDEKFIEILKDFSINQSQQLGMNIYELIYSNPQDKRLFSLLSKYYDTTENPQIQNLILWWSVIQFHDIDFLAQLIVSEISFGREEVVEKLLTELKRVKPSHPAISKIEEFLQNV
jgi:glycosyltransferase involved in cell wall biosynthesis